MFIPATDFAELLVNILCEGHRGSCSPYILWRAWSLYLFPETLRSPECFIPLIIIAFETQTKTGERFADRKGKKLFTAFEVKLTAHLYRF